MLRHRSCHIKGMEDTTTSPEANTGVKISREELFTEDNIMAIPGMITDFSRQQANYGMAVGQSLQQLGQQVGQQLANQEYQRQAAAQLPFITQQMQEAAKEASTGKFGDAYSKILGLTANPQVMQNPFILPALEMGMQAIQGVGEATAGALGGIGSAYSQLATAQGTLGGFNYGTTRMGAGGGSVGGMGTFGPNYGMVYKG